MIGGTRAADHLGSLPLGTSVRLDATGIGCGSLDGLRRLADILVGKGEEATLAAMRENGCRLLTTFQGEVVNSDDGVICVLGASDAQCVWFVTEGFRTVGPSR